MEAKYLEWLQSSDTGLSSETIWRTMLSDNPNELLGHRNNIPSDVSDFGRCYRLLQKFPEWLSQLEKLKVLGSQWEVFVNNYHEMAELYKEESPKRDCPKLYKLMKELSF